VYLNRLRLHPIATNTYVLQFLIAPLQIEPLRAHLHAALDPLMRDGQFFGEVALGEEFAADLYFWLKDDLPFYELVEVREVDLATREVDGGTAQKGFH
jgi:hypothetical protein